MTQYHLDSDAAERVAAFGPIPPMRQRGLSEVRRAIESAPHPENMPAMADIEDRFVPGTGGSVPIRIYRPSPAGDTPVLVYFHGGGMVLGSNHSFEPLARTLAAHTEAAVVSVDYRLAPEAPAPAQFEDAYAATSYVAANADELGIDSQRLAVVGDSAGGSLAAAVALAARDRGGPPIRCQVLLYPGLDRDMACESIRTMPDAPMLHRDDIDFMHALADQGVTTPPDQYRFPAMATDLTHLPEAIVVTAEYDPIRDWGEQYAHRLREAGVQTTLTRYPGIYHGFLMRSDATARGRLAVAEIGALLRAKFANPLPFGRRETDVPMTGHVPSHR
ncbi:alpha/beta hydrolase [Mycobacterium sp. 852014-52144_SCH5372336]|uniref:alpha/beta hydrolase n=1 Tax=Mycobacterium sp. 852014-52144_SCH5372336 TaxID=1834115 RepID=UPI00080064F2|nr:alpha/beta hydrolase [Mycobacterium sp. 852014-52144_SCH5372336]OBB72571.1 alpha/beta hydrolase [Mycobacterium sp. 852014-52144_SCH5372336]